jgi:SAM-dependent methyltransferase
MADLLTTVQRSIDAIDYPPTHQYDVRTLTPRGVLAERVKRILELCPRFFHAERFLDVGANKGFFTLKAAKTCRQVVAVEPDEETLGAWILVRPDNVLCISKHFDELQVKHLMLGGFDVVWVGNGHHYLHRAQPEHWVEQLAMFAWGDVLIEGPTGPLSQGFSDWAAGTVPVEAEWLAQASKYELELQGAVASPLNGRKIWHLQRISP